jgi:signal transduction histidine kinase
VQLALIVGAAIATGRALPALQAWMVGQLLLQVAVILAAITLMSYSYWRLVDPVGRAQIRWIGAAVLLMALSGFVLWFGPELVIGEPLVPRSAVALLGLPFPVALGVAISRHQLFSLGNLVNRSAVYAGLTAGIVIAYAGTVVVVSSLIPRDATFATTLLGVGAVALVALPLRDRLQRAVDRLMYGDRADPYRAVRRLGQRLEGTLDPRTVLPTLVETVAESLRLPYVAIELERDGEIVGAASTGTRPIGGIGSPELEQLPIAYRGTTVGRLILAHRDPGERFSRADEQLLADLARQAAPAVEAVRLAADLQRSREQLVTAREEERRRLRRDLHDGFGPTLAASLMKLQAARALADREPARSQELLDELEAETRRTIEGVRRVAYDLRPPALDELGLIGALRQHAASLSVGPDAPRIDVVVQAPDAFVGLPAAVEVAGLRIALEALTNVVRHSGAARASVVLTIDDRELLVAVTDDGRGMPVDGSPGIGLGSMRERAEELGGSLRVEPGTGGGTQVVARLPIVSAAAP